MFGCQRLTRRSCPTGLGIGSKSVPGRKAPPCEVRCSSASPRFWCSICCVARWERRAQAKGNVGGQEVRWKGLSYVTNTRANSFFQEYMSDGFIYILRGTCVFTVMYVYACSTGHHERSSKVGSSGALCEDGALLYPQKERWLPTNTCTFFKCKINTSVIALAIRLFISTMASVSFDDDRAYVRTTKKKTKGNQKRQICARSLLITPFHAYFRLLCLARYISYFGLPCTIPEHSCEITRKRKQQVFDGRCLRVAWHSIK